MKNGAAGPGADSGADNGCDRMRQRLVLVIGLLLSGIVVGCSSAIQPLPAPLHLVPLGVSANPNSTVTIVSSTGTNIATGNASALTALPNQTVRVVNSSNQVLDTLGGGGGTLITSGAGAFGSGTSQSGGVLTGTLVGGSESTCNSSGQISGGAYDPKCTAFGALGIGKIAYDGAVPAVIAAGSGTTATSPTITTNLPNELLITDYNVYQTFTGPSGPTVRANGIGGSGIFIYESAAATTGSYGGLVGTLGSTAGWSATSIGLYPTTGNSLGFIAAAGAASSGSNETSSVPTGTLSGHTMIACGNAGSAITITPPAGNKWISLFNFTTGNERSFCYERVAGGSEPANYTWTCNTTCNGGIAIVTYSNVGGIDDPVTSAGASFTSGLVGELACVAGGGCGVVPTGGALSGTKMIYGGMNNGTSALSGAEYRYVTNDTAAFAAVATAVDATGGTVWIPPGNYGLNAPWAINTAYGVNIVGNGSTYNNFHFQSNNLAGNTTGLWWETQALTSAALSVNNGGPSKISDFDMHAGAGLNASGGGSDGLAPQGITNIANLNIANFAGSCMNFGTVGNGLGIAQNVFTQWCGLDGVRFDSTALQNEILIGDTFQNNSGCGANWTAGGVFSANFTFIDDLFQGNDLANNSGGGELCASQNENGQIAFISGWFDTTYPNSHSLISSADQAYFTGT